MPDALKGTLAGPVIWPGKMHLYLYLPLLPINILSRCLPLRFFLSFLSSSLSSFSSSGSSLFVSLGLPLFSSSSPVFPLPLQSPPLLPWCVFSHQIQGQLQARMVHSTFRSAGCRGHPLHHNPVRGRASPLSPHRILFNQEKPAARAFALATLRHSTAATTHPINREPPGTAGHEQRPSQLVRALQKVT